MKGTIVLISFLLGSVLAIIAQTDLELKPHFSEEKQLYGYIDASGKLRIPYKYSKAGAFFENNAVVRKNGLYGVVNHKGKELFPPKYYDIERVDSCKAFIIREAKTMKFGLADFDAKMILDFEYTSIESIGKLIIIEKNLTYGILNKNLEFIFPFGLKPKPSELIDGLLFVHGYSDNKTEGCINTNGEVIIPFIYYDFDVTDKLIVAWKSKKTCDFFSRDGIKLSEQDFEEVVEAGKGYYAVKLNDKWGIFSERGLIVPCLYDFPIPITQEEGVFVMQKDQKYGLVDTDGNELCEFVYDTLEKLKLSDKKFLVKIQDKSGVIDNSGKTLIPVEYSFISGKLNDDLLLFKDDKFGMADVNGNIIVPCQLDKDFAIANPLVAYNQCALISYCCPNSDMYNFSLWMDSCFAVDEKNKKVFDVALKFQYDIAGEFYRGCAFVGKKLSKNKVVFALIDTTGNFLTDYVFYKDYYFDHLSTSDIPRFIEGYCIVESNTSPVKYAVIDTTGKFIADYVFDNIYPFNKNGRAYVNINNKWGAIDTRGQYIIPCTYDRIKRLSADTLAVFNNEIKKWLIINAASEQIVDKAFFDVKDWSLGLGLIGVMDSAAAAWGYVDLNGEYKIKPLYKDVRAFDQSGLAAVRNLEDMWGIINTKGETVVPFDLIGVSSSGFKYGLCGISNFYLGYALIDKTGKFVKGWNDTIKVDYEFLGYNMAFCRWLDKVYNEKGETLKDTKNEYYSIQTEYNQLNLEQGYITIVNREGKISTTGLIDRQFNVVIDLNVFQDLGVYSGGLLPAKRKGKWGYIRL